MKWYPVLLILAACALLLPLAGSTAVAAGPHPARPHQDMPPPAPSPAPPEQLRVGVSECPPFIIHDKNGEYTGLLLDLFKMITADMQVTYEIVPLDWNDFLAAVKQDRVDLGVSCTAITEEREKVMDFSHAYYDTNLTAVVRDTGPLQSLLRIFVSWNTLAILFSIFLLAALIGALTWFIEHRDNPEVFTLPGRGGMLLDMLLCGVNFIFSGGLDYNEYQTMSGRVIAVAGRVVNTFFITGLIAVLAGSVTSAMLAGQINDPGDLADIKVGVTLETVGEEYLIENQIDYTVYATDVEMLDDLETGKIDAALEDEPILQYIIGQASKKGRYQNMSILPWQLKVVKFGIAMPEGSPLREPVNRALLKILESDYWEEYEDSYFGN